MRPRKPSSRPIAGLSLDPEATIAVWGHYHGGNLGDELVVATVVRAIRRRLPRARVVAVSMAPEDTRERHGVPAYPIAPGARRSLGGADPAKAGLASGVIGRRALRRVARAVPGARRVYAVIAEAGRLALEPAFAWRSYRVVRDLDAIVVAGSGQLLDGWRGPWEHPLALFRWTALARLARVPVAFASVGAGPIDGRLAAFFIRSALARAGYASVRDAKSERVLRSIGVRRRLVHCPDMGYAYLAPRARRHPRPDERPVVALNAMAYQDPRYWQGGRPELYARYLRELAAVTCAVVEGGCRVCLFSSQITSDPRVAEDLVGLLGGHDPDVLPAVESALARTAAVDDLIEVVAAADYVVACRYHAVLLPLLLGVPVIGLAYEPKTQELLSEVGRADDCLDIASFTAAELLARLEALRERDEAAAAELQRRVAQHHAAVEEQFDALFGPRRD